MANLIFPLYKEALITGSANISLSGGNIKATLIDLADYTYSASHDFYDDVPAAAREEISANLASKTVALGVFDAADFVFTAAAGDPCEALIIWIDTGTPSTSRLVAYYDAGVTGLPVTLNGGDVNITVNASGFFAI